MNIFKQNPLPLSSSRGPMSIGPWRSYIDGIASSSLAKLRIPRNDNIPIRSQRRSRDHGFTLLELLVSVGIISMIVVILTEVFFSIGKSNSKVGIQSETKQSGDYALSVMDRMIRNARSVTSVCTGAADTFLTIVNPDNKTTTFSCSTDLVDTTITRIASDSGAATIEYLTSSAVTLGACTESPLVFTCTPSTGLPSQVKISFTLTQKGAPLNQYDKSTSAFATTINLRN